jgi:hypothetical protein
MVPLRCRTSGVGRISLKNSEIEGRGKSRIHAPSVVYARRRHSNTQQSRSLSRAPKEISIEAASGLVNCDRGRNSSFSTVSDVKRPLGIARSISHSPGAVTHERVAKYGEPERRPESVLMPEHQNGGNIWYFGLCPRPAKGLPRNPQKGAARRIPQPHRFEYSTAVSSVTAAT